MHNKQRRVKKSNQRLKRIKNKSFFSSKNIQNKPDYTQTGPQIPVPIGHVFHTPEALFQELSCGEKLENIYGIRDIEYTNYHPKSPSQQIRSAKWIK